VPGDNARLTSSTPMSPMSSWASPRRALALLAVWLLATLGLRPLLLPDEGRYANVAREMLQGDGLTPLLNGLPFFHKPPLMYWLDMAAMSVVGVNHFSARFGPFIGAWVMGAALFLAVRRWHGERPALLALLALATTPFFFVGGQYANLDMMVGGMLTATILAFARAADDERPELRWVVAAWSLAALSVLAKGLIGIVLPALVLGPWLLVRGQWRVVLRLLNPLGIAVFVLIALPWFALMQHRYPGFFDYFVMEQHFRRFAQTNFNNVHPWWFYLVALPVLTLPWSLWLPRVWREVSAADRARMGLYGWWIVAIVGFFSLPSSKLVGYVLPAVAPWCLLLSMAASRAERWRLATAAAGALAGLAAVVALTIKAPHSAQPVARELASRMAPNDRVVFVDEVYFDLSYDANLKRPAIILSDWASPDIPKRDNWRKELWDAARFDPVQAQAVLWQLDRAPELSCGDTAAWFVLKPGNERLLAAVPGLESVTVHRDVKLMRAAARRC
jgi:4-amino-4-deoxy-L-arabinose transferase-like glycosyltransferase